MRVSDPKLSPTSEPSHKSVPAKILTTSWGLAELLLGLSLVRMAPSTEDGALVRKGQQTQESMPRRRAGTAMEL